MTIEALLKKQRSPVKGVISGGWQSGSKALGKEIGHSGEGVLALPVVAPNLIDGGRLIEQRHQAGLSYGCGDRYFPGHRCRRQLLLLEGEDDEEKVAEENSEVEREDKGEISLHALKGLVHSKIIKVKGRAHNCSLMVLIDSGSTHSFLDESMAKKLGCEVSNSHSLSVIVANGNKVLSQSSCLGFCWEMNGEEFMADLILMKLGGCDVVLGED